MEYVTIKSRVLGTLRTRKRPMSCVDIVHKLGDTTTQTIYATISQLKKEGHNIVSAKAKDGYTRYSLQA